MSAGFGPGQLYRVQADDGRGPWRPGLSRHWIDETSHQPLFPNVLESFGLDWLGKIPRGWHAGCACRSLSELFAWFTPIEMERLAAIGYYPVVLMPDKIIDADAHQVVFARKRPLNEGIEILSWPRS